MKERPILFSGPMVRAILEGRKTQTRRVVASQMAIEDIDRMATCHPILGDAKHVGSMKVDREMIGSMCSGELTETDIVRLWCKYGVPGDRLWVKEAFWKHRETGIVRYADGASDASWKEVGWKKVPSIHMPRAASRLTLDITDVRVERLQEISEVDAAAEGMTQNLCEEVLCAAAKVEPQESYCVRSDTEDFTEGHQCRYCAERTKKKHASKGAYIVAEGCPESDGPAYCDDCHSPLLMSLTSYGIEREFFLEGFGDQPPPDNRKYYATSGLDAAIAGMIAGGIGDLRDEHKGRLNQIGYATLWESINGRGSWDANPWVWVIEFKKAKEAGQ